jgi:hypothetical protein
LAFVVGLGLKVRKAALSFGIISASSSVMRTKVVADAAEIGAALDVATRPRNVVITETVTPGGVIVPGTKTPAPTPKASGGFFRNIIGGAAGYLGVKGLGGAIARGRASGLLLFGLNPATFDAVALLSLIFAGGGDAGAGRQLDDYPAIAALVARIDSGQPITAAEQKALLPFHSKTVGNMSAADLKRMDAALALAAGRTRPGLTRRGLVPPFTTPGVATHPRGYRTTAPPKGTTPKREVPLPLDEQIALNISRARSTGNQVALVAALKAQIDFDNKYEALQEGLLKTDVAHKGQHAKILERLYGDEASAQGELDSINEAAAVAKRAKNAAAAQAIRERARQYRAGLYTTETNLKTAVKAAKTPEGVARADDALIAFYKQEGADAKLTNPERARYRLAYEKTKAAEAKLLKDAQDKADRHAKKQHMDALRATGSRLRGAVYAATTVAGERRAESALVAFYRLSAKDKLVEVAMQKHYGELADRAQDKLDKQIEAADAKAEKARKKAAKTKHLTGLEIRENRLQNATARAELTDTLTDDRVRIQAEIAFYKAEAHDRTLSTLARIAYEKQQIEAEKKLKALDKQELATKASVAASVAEAFASFNSVQQRFAGNYQTASNGKLETHGYETVHELRGIRASVETANKRGRYPMSDYSGPAAWAAGS